jgi:hypothetical protein
MNFVSFVCNNNFREGKQAHHSLHLILVESKRCPAIRLTQAVQINATIWDDGHIHVLEHAPLAPTKHQCNQMTNMEFIVIAIKVELQ